MKITVIEWYKAADRDCCLIDLAENNLPTESKTELRKVLVLGMDIEIDGVDYKLRGIDAYATDHIPGGKVGLWVEKQYNWADVTINICGVELKGITGMKFEQPLNFGNDFLARHKQWVKNKRVQLKLRRSTYDQWQRKIFNSLPISNKQYRVISKMR